MIIPSWLAAGRKPAPVLAPDDLHPVTRDDDIIGWFRIASGRSLGGNLPRVEGFPPGADPDSYRTQFAATRRLRTSRSASCSEQETSPITYRGAREYVVLGCIRGRVAQTPLRPSPHRLHVDCTAPAPVPV